jgi:hypothetical protein
MRPTVGTRLSQGGPHAWQAFWKMWRPANSSTGCVKAQLTPGVEWQQLTQADVCHVTIANARLDPSTVSSDVFGQRGARSNYDCYGYSR